jgi:hypothetical protein
LQPSKNIPQKETANLLNKCWMTHDAMWFFHCLQEFGIEAANKINKSAIKSLSSIEIGRLKKTLEIDKPIKNFGEFKNFFEETSQLLIPDFMNVTFGYPEENQMSWNFIPGKCFAYAGIKRMGAIDQYECGVLYRIKCWLDALGIQHEFIPEIARCNMHHGGDCSGYIKLFL